MKLLDLFETKVTDNPNFKRWFGDSKVVDSNGEPLVVYHGTNQDFDTFKGMVWGSVGKDLPQDYAAMRAEFNGGNASIMPLYLRIIKPFNADLLPKTVTISDVFNSMFEQAGYNEGNISDSLINKMQPLWDTVNDARHEEGSGPHYNRHDFWNETSMLFGRKGSDAIKQAFVTLGFDGVQMMEGGELTFGAFEPSQAKSAFNSGNYDSDSANISEENLMELRARYVNNSAADGDSLILAFRGNYWLLGDYGDLDDTPENVIMDIYQSLGIENSDGSDPELDDFSSIMYDELRDNRPDVLFGNVTNGELYLSNSTLNNPVVTPLIKKIVQELGLRGVNSEESTFDGDSEEHYYHKNELTGKLPEVLYHGTSSDKVREISRYGLRPNQDSNWEEQGITHDGLVFGAPSYQGALFHANRTSGISYETEYLEPDDPFPVILAFKVPDPNQIEPDYDVAAATMGYSDHATSLGYTDKNNYSAYSPADDVSKNNPEGRTWKTGNAFAYRGRIPASHIVGIYTNFMRGGLTAEADWSGVSFKDFFEEWDDMQKQYYGYDDEDYDDEDYHDPFFDVEDN